MVRAVALNVLLLIVFCLSCFTERHCSAVRCPKERRKASQRHSRPAAPLQPLISRLWHPGDRVRWRDRIGIFRRDVGDSEHAEIVIADRTYRVRIGDLA